MADAVSIGTQAAQQMGEQGKPKGLSDMGGVNAQDLDKFQQSMGQGGGMNIGQTAQPQPQMQAGGPFDMQVNRVQTDVQPQSLGDAVGKDVSDILKVGQQQEQALKAELDRMGTDGWSPGDALKFQYMAGEISMMTEIVSKGVNKITQAASSMARNQ